jgi:competence protein ComEA
MKSFFNFTSSELSGAITISVFILILIVNLFLRGEDVSSHEIPSSFKTLAEQLEKQELSTYGNSKYTRFENEIDPSDSIKNKQKTPRKLEYEIIKLNINQCDTTDVKGVPQFGSARAMKLIEYRNRMGGFHSLGQVQEVFILKEIEIEFLEQYFYIKSSDVKKIKINSATYEELKTHPYFDAYLSKQVIKYREKNGRIKSIEDFQRATNAYGTLVGKLKPYLDFE